MLRHRFLLYFVTCFSCLSFASHANASGSKLGFSAGAFNFSSQSSTGSTSLSNLGIYKVLYSKSIIDRFNFVGGYSVIMEDTFGGDVAYGFDFGASYSFYPSSAPMNFENTLIEIATHWEPFVSLTFHQRQFQSIKTGYTGFGFGGGFEKPFKKGMWIYVDLRYIMLTGTSSTKATEITTTIGLTFSL